MFLRGGVKTFLIAEAAVYSDPMQYNDYLSYEQVDEDEDGTYDYIMIKSGDESAVSVEIPSEINGLPVTEIAASAFHNCSGLTSVVIPDSVTSIGAGVFSGCTSLANVEIPNSVTIIGMNAFSDTPILENQTGVKYVGEWVVDCDKDVIEAEIKSGTKGIACSVFSGCTSLKNI